MSDLLKVLCTWLQYKLKMPDETRDLIRHLHPAMKQKVRVALAEILENPGCGKALRGELQGLRSFRVSKFRIIYRAVAQVIEVILKCCSNEAKEPLRAA